MKLFRKLLLVAPILFGVAMAGTTWGDDHAEDHFIHEVAHPRACVLVDDLGELKGAAENFAHGHEEDGVLIMNLFVPIGTTVYFKSGFGYEGVWYADATGTLSTMIEVSLKDGDAWDHVGTREHTKTATGPRIEKGSISVPIKFDEVGEFMVRSELRTSASAALASAADESVLAVDEDTVVTYVTVAEGPEIILIHPENEAVLPPAPPPYFKWSGFGFKKYQLQLSTSEGFDSQKTMKLPPFGGTKRTGIKMRKKLWKIIRKWEEENEVIYWRVLGKTKKGETIGKSDTWEFSIGDVEEE